MYVAYYSININVINDDYPTDHHHSPIILTGAFLRSFACFEPPLPRYKRLGHMHTDAYIACAVIIVIIVITVIIVIIMPSCIVYRRRPSAKTSSLRPRPRASEGSRRSRGRCRSRARTWRPPGWAGAPSGRPACTGSGPATSTWWAPWATVWWPATGRSRSTRWARWSSTEGCLGQQVYYIYIYTVRLARAHLKYFRPIYISNLHYRVGPVIFSAPPLLYVTMIKTKYKLVTVGNLFKSGSWCSRISRKQNEPTLWLALIRDNNPLRIMTYTKLIVQYFHILVLIVSIICYTRVTYRPCNCYSTPFYTYK